MKSSRSGRALITKRGEPMAKRVPANMHIDDIYVSAGMGAITGDIAYAVPSEEGRGDLK
jgi:hypothetical protein